MLNARRVYMLAADHRWQWEEWCDARQMPRTRIGEVKRLAYDGFLLARERSADVREFGALLVDEQYASAVVADALKAGLDVGTPAEKAGAFPLAWSAEPFSRALTGAFVKVLVRHRPDDEEAVREGQWEKLDALQAWCRGAGKPLVMEILVARRGEAEDEFEAVGRPAMLAGFIAEAYRRELTPEFWKIEGTLSPEGAQHDRRGDCREPRLPADHPRQGGRPRPSAAGSRRPPPAPQQPASRSDVGVLGALGRVSERREDGGSGGGDICANYLQLVDAWQQSRV